MEQSKSAHFVILFRGLKNHAFKGLYSYDPLLHQVLKLNPSTNVPAAPDASRPNLLGPESIDETGVLEFYKYDSGSRSFKPLPTQSFGMSVHAVSVRSEHRKRAMNKIS